MFSNSMVHMAKLDWAETHVLERLFKLQTGWVLDFTDATFRSFFEDHHIDIEAKRYHVYGGSKGKRMRAFLKLDADHTVGRVLSSMIDYGEAKELFSDLEDAPTLVETGRGIAKRLLEHRPVVEIDALIQGGDGRDIETIVEHISQAIEDGRPEGSLDRLHTYMVKHIRALCKRHDIEVKKDSALHSIFGLYGRALHEAGHIESRMTIEILRATGRVLEPFNEVRNHRSLAHDNELLKYEESTLILNHVAATVRFLNALERTIDERAVAPNEFNLPF